MHNFYDMLTKNERKYLDEEFAEFMEHLEISLGKKLNNTDKAEECINSCAKWIIKSR